MPASLPDPRARLVHVLRSAYSGELAAAYAYRGHARSVRTPAVRARIAEIEHDEWHHRTLVGGLLAQLGSGPSAVREAVFWTIGKTIGFLCLIGGWFIPMYGAGRLEKFNVAEYEDAAALALEAGHAGMLDCLLTMAEVEWEHERFFREQVAGHWLTRVVPVWDPPVEKSALRARYAEVVSEPVER
jgi:rubrerythrin